MNLKYLFIVNVCMSMQMISQAQFTIDAQLRNRTELRDGYKKLAADSSIPAFFISQRTRLNFNYETENFKLKFSPQDVRVWGDDEDVTLSGNNGNSASIDLYEGYAEIKLGILGWLSVGRQSLVYDNQSLLSNSNWNQNGSATDAIILKYNRGDLNIHLAGSWNTMEQASSDNLYPANRYKTIDFLWLNYGFTDKMKASLIHVTSGITQTDSTNKINFRQTTGVYAILKTDNLNAWTDIYCQYGKNQAGNYVSAFMADAEISYQSGRITPAIGLSYLSGNSRTGEEQNVDHLFDAIYRSRHGFFGGMDYFTNFSSHTKQGGLEDYYVSVNYSILKTLSVQNTGHYFRLAQTNTDTPDDKNLGYENDLIVKYKFNDWGSVEGGSMFFLPGQSLKTLQNVTDDKFSQFFYLQLTLTPALFKQDLQK